MHDLQVEIYGSFRPGDVVIAEVLSLGDARSYYLSTAKNDLGVVYAKSVAGKSWRAQGAPPGPGCRSLTSQLHQFGLAGPLLPDVRSELPAPCHKGKKKLGYYIYSGINRMALTGVA